MKWFFGFIKFNNIKNVKYTKNMKFTKNLALIFLFFFILLLFNGIYAKSEDENFKFFSDPLEQDYLYREFLSEISYNYNCKSSSGFLHLRFAYYKPKYYDDLYRIANYFQLSVDTLASVNNIFSQYLYDSSEPLIIPNCEGIFIEYNKKAGLDNIAKLYSVSKNAILYINVKESEGTIKDGEKIFIPLAHFTKDEKILFLGSLFRDPLKGKGILTSSFGQRIDPFTHKPTFHGGIDIAVKIGTPVYPAMPGKVSFTGYKGDYGYLVVIDHGYGYQTLYGHLGEIKVQPGINVSYDDIIALSGNTGRTTGPHLHFEIKFEKQRVNPMDLLFLSNQ